MNLTTKITTSWTTVFERLFPVREFKLTEINLRVSRLLQERRAELRGA